MTLRFLQFFTILIAGVRAFAKQVIIEVSSKRKLIFFWGGCQQQHVGIVVLSFLSVVFPLKGRITLQNFTWTYSKFFLKAFGEIGMAVKSYFKRYLRWSGIFFLQ